MSLATVVPFPNEAAVLRSGHIENELNEMGACINALDATVEGERFLRAREYLFRRMEMHHMALERILFPDGM